MFLLIAFVLYLNNLVDKSFCSNYFFMLISISEEYVYYTIEEVVVGDYYSGTIINDEFKKDNNHKKTIYTWDSDNNS